MTFNFSSDRSKRKAKRAWEDVLLKQKNYLSQPEEVIKIPFLERLPYEIKLQTRGLLVANDNAKEAMRNLIEVIYDIPDIKNSCTFETVCKIVKHELGIELSRVIESNPLRNFDAVLESLFSNIQSSIKTYDFYFALRGIELVNILKIDIDSVQVLKFDIELIEEFISKDEDTQEINRKIIEEGFVDKVCIKVCCSGDLSFAREKAEFKVEAVLNYFRFVMCWFFLERMYQNFLKIGILSETYSDKNQILVKEVNSSKPIHQLDLGRTSLQDFPITEEIVAELKENLYFDTVIPRLLNSEEKTELEGTLLTALHWCGEAQNEFDPDVAFFKYWTALECIFSYRKDDNKTTYYLRRGISRLAAYSDYEFITLDEIEQVSSSVNKLYDKRSDIIHQGQRNNVTSVELTKVCKYASWMILILMSFVSDGLETIKDLDERIHDFDEAYTSYRNSDQS